MKPQVLALLAVAALLVPSQSLLAETLDSDTNERNRGMLKRDLQGDELRNNDLKNSARNERDADENTILPEDQSEEKIFRDRTASIRQDVVANDSLSSAAKNIKIITLSSGNVILRGVVESASEKATLEQLARRHSGSNKVTSFLEVNTPRM